MGGVVWQCGAMGWKRLFTIGLERHGVVALDDAEACGLPRAVLMARAIREGWRPLHPGVYLLPGAPDTPMARLSAAVLWIDGYAARRSALWLHGVVDQAPVRPQVLVTHRRRGVAGRHVDMHRSRRLPDDHLTEVAGLAATSVARAVHDLAVGGEHPRRLTALVLEAERRRAMRRGDLAVVRESFGRGCPGLATVDRVLEDLGAMRSDSGWEHRVRSDLRRLGLPVHPAPFPYRCEDGVIVELDVAIPTHWVYLECDGRGFHSATDAWGKDRRKWTQVTRQWRPVWVTYDRWRYERDAVLADVHRAMQLADPGRAPAIPAR